MLRCLSVGLGCWFIFERRLAAVGLLFVSSNKPLNSLSLCVQHTGSSRKRLTARGQRPAFPGSCSNAARRGNFFGLLRSPSSRQRPSRARLAGSVAANSTARCVDPEFMPNTVLSPWRAAGTLSTPSGSHQTGALGIVRQCVRAARQLPRGQRRWRNWVGRLPCERARARTCRLTAGAGRPSRGERRPWSSGSSLRGYVASPSGRPRGMAVWPHPRVSGCGRADTE